LTTISYKVAIIGAGLIGKKRAAALAQIGSCELVSCADINLEAAKELTGQFGGKATSNWQQAASDKDVSLVIVATYNKSLAPICIEALQNGKHVLCEKPLGRNCKEAAGILDAAKGSGAVLKTGFNHRHHPAIVKARQVFGAAMDMVDVQAMKMNGEEIKTFAVVAKCSIREFMWSICLDTLPVSLIMLLAILRLISGTWQSRIMHSHCLEETMVL
jgi:threonine dehydrogenase-like Zn-dependent dehydrogenase